MVIANSRFYGKGMAIAPDAAIDDGELDVVVIEAAGRLDLIRSLPKVYDGAHVALRRGQGAARDPGHRVRSVRRHRRRPSPSAPTASRSASCPATGDEPLVVDIRPGAVKILR